MDDQQEVDPRARRTPRAVLAAAGAVLLDEGRKGVTVGRVAARSGDARTTLHRHWPQRLDLLRDLIREEADLAHTSRPATCAPTWSPSSKRSAPP